MCAFSHFNDAQMNGEVVVAKKRVELFQVASKTNMSEIGGSSF